MVLNVHTKKPPESEIVTVAKKKKKKKKNESYTENRILCRIHNTLFTPLREVTVSIMRWRWSSATQGQLRMLTSVPVWCFKAHHSGWYPTKRDLNIIQE